MTRFFQSIHYAIQGICHNWKTQKNFRIHGLGFLFMHISAYYLQFDRWEYIACLILACLVLCAEMINTAIESTIDLYTDQLHPMAKVAKDSAAGAVLILAICAVVVWSIIAWEKIHL